MSKFGKLLRHPILFFGDAWRKRIGPGNTHKTGIQYSPGLDSGDLTDPVAVYFAGGQAHIYQLSQWIAPLLALQQAGLTVTIICRTVVAFHWAIQNTAFKVVYCKTIDDLLRLYQLNPFKCILYVNNANRNFQSLINAKALHVHINHGESEKISTFSNQTKAYDYVLVSGAAALEKYEANLIKKDLSRYLQIGRPQIEHTNPIPDPFAGAHQSKLLTVLYAPTWEGTHEEMNYSSVASMGLELVRTVLSNPAYRLIYRPHPNTGKRLSDNRQANQRISQYVQQHNNGCVQADCDINALFAHVDVAIFDNSAVAVDYLAVNKPMVLTRWQHEHQNQDKQAAIAQAGRVVGPEDLPQLPYLLGADVHQDPFALQRQSAKNHYIGQFDTAQQASTQQFVTTVAQICTECAALNRQLQGRTQTSTASTT